MSTAPQSERRATWQVLKSAFSNRKTGFMLSFGIASGLPFSLFLGTLYAWLTEAKVDLETMGVFSLIGLAYAFQFLWSPIIDKVDLKGFRRLGRRKQWIVPSQILIGSVLLLLSMSEPSNDNLGWFSLLAGIGALASATQDIAINAWRIDNADEEATLDILSTVYQMGYRLAALLGGAVGLVIAARIGWANTYVIMGSILLVIGTVGIRAPDGQGGNRGSENGGDPEVLKLRQAGELTPAVRMKALIMVASLWIAAVCVIIVFMTLSLGLPAAERPDAGQFTFNWGPWIVVATIVLPALIAGRLVALKREGKHVLAEDAPDASTWGTLLDHLYRALLVPLVDFVGRMGWSLVLIISLVLTYRICDAIWGSFAYPFYLGELKYSNDEVAFASKFFGVGAIVFGLALGGVMLTRLGRMSTLTIGAILAALTNLLYADLAVGGEHMQAFSDATGFTWLIMQLPGGSAALAKLTITIGFENLAIGIAGAAYIAWLSSIVSKEYSAVQYALLSSLTLLVGTLGRGALGKMIDEQGYYDVFILTTALGAIAVVLCVAEWIRQLRSDRLQHAPTG